MVSTFSTRIIKHFMGVSYGVSKPRQTSQCMYLHPVVSPSFCSNNKHSSDTSITDLWSRAVSYHFLNETTLANFFTNDTAHGAGQLWSQLTQTAMYQQFQVPFPIVHANSRPVGSDDTGFLNLNSTVYEVKPS